jgi:putative ABC transport system permease protein
MTRFAVDLRLARRALRRGRAITAFAVVAFALGIGITTAVFSLFYGVLLKPLPFPEPDRLVVVYDTQPACTTCPASFEKHIDWKTRNTVFEALGGSQSTTAVITGVGEPERVTMAPATASLMDVFQTPPGLGRWFTEAEDASGGPKVVVLSDGYWRRTFNADPAVLGRTISINAEPYEVIGVLPASFSHRRADLFVPVQRRFDAGNRGNHFLAQYGRLKPGVTLEQAQREMRALGGVLAQEFGHNHGIDVQSYTQVVIGTLVQPLQLLMGAVTFVLLIACANVANLLLASGLARRRELAVRTALGATRWDLVRQLTVESTALAIVGGALGVLLAQWSIVTFVDMADAILPRTATIALDGTVLLFAAGLSLLTGVFCGLWPVVRLNARTLGRDVHEGTMRAGGSAGSRRFGNGLVVVEIALAFALLVGAGLLVKNLVGLQSRETGFKVEGIVAFDLSPTGDRYKDNAFQAFYRELLPRLKTLPDVNGVGATSHLPMYQFGWNGEVALEGGNPWLPRDAPLIERAWIDDAYLAVMGIQIIRGRSFTARDTAAGPRVTIISERTAEKFWPGENALGRRFSRGAKFGGDDNVFEVVGVARDVLTYGLQRVSPYIMYIPVEQEPFGAMTIVLRTATDDPTAVIPAARQIVRSMDPLLPVARVQTMEQVVAQSVSQPRLISALTSLFGLLAGSLAAVGVYGVMAYNVRRERREFGIRLALGADPRRVRRLVVGRGLLLGGLGVAIGAGGALLLTRTVQALLNDVQATDPTVFVVAGVVLLATTILAGYLPALQASRTDPMIVLRSE